MNLKSKLEDITFSVIQHLPIVPSFLMNWADDYLNRRIAELNHETVSNGIKLLLKRLYQKSMNGSRIKKSTNEFISLMLLSFLFSFTEFRHNVSTYGQSLLFLHILQNQLLQAPHRLDILICAEC